MMIENFTSLPIELAKQCRCDDCVNRNLDLIIGVLCVIFSVVASCGNLSALIYIKINGAMGNSAKQRRNFIHRMTILMITNIALSDFFTGVFSASFNAANLLKEDYPSPSPTIIKILCNFCGFVHFIATRASILLMCMLSIFRYIAIVYPTKINDARSLKIMKVAVALIWVSVCLMAALPYYFKTNYEYWSLVSHCWFHFWQLESGKTNLCEYLKDVRQGPSIISFFSLYIAPVQGPGLIMIICTGLILYKLTRLHVTIRTSKAQIKLSEAGLHAKAAATTLLILLCFVLTYISWWVISFIHFLDMVGFVNTANCPTGHFWRCKLGKYWGYTLMISMNVMIYINSALNPFIYYYRLFQRNEAARKALFTSRGTATSIERSKVSVRPRMLSTEECTLSNPPKDNLGKKGKPCSMRKLVLSGNCVTHSGDKPYKCDSPTLRKLNLNSRRGLMSNTSNEMLTEEDFTSKRSVHIVSSL